MGDNFLPLSDLVYGTNWGTIRVRVCRLWQSMKRDTKEVYSINMQFVDVQGSDKHAIVPKGLMSRYEETFAEELIYEIRTFNVFNSDSDYRVIDDEWTIFIRRDTDVQIVTDFDESIPRFKFGFVSDDVLAKRLGINKQLIDVGGVLRGISPKSPVTTRKGFQTIKRDLRVETLSGKMVTTTLWSDKTELIDESVLAIHPFPVSVVITSTTVNIFQGKFTFASTNATKVYVNIHIPETNDIVQRARDDTKKKIELILDTKSTTSSNDAPTLTKTIAAIMSDIRDDACKGKRYSFQAIIMKITNSVAWSYLSCPICKKTVTKTEYGFNCPKCVASVENPLTRYRVTIEISDHTATASITAFDKEAELLINKKADDMKALLLMDNGQEQIDKIFDTLIGVEAKFEIRPSTYDIDTKGKCLTANKITKMKTDSKSTATITEIGEASGISVNEGSKTDASMESNYFNKSESSYKGKEKVCNDSKFNSNKMTEKPDACSQTYRAKKARGIVIQEGEHNRNGGKKIMGTRQGKKRNKA